MMNNLEELNKLEKQIKETQSLLNETVENKEKLKISKQWNVILGLLTLIFLASSIWLFFSNKNEQTGITTDNELVVNNDSINIYKTFYLNNSKVKDSTSTAIPITTSLTSLKDKKIIYSVQLGAFQKFNINSKSLLNLKEFKSDGYSKISVGNFETYEEAKRLKDSLMKLGFNDCFLTAQSFGNNISIKDALELSNESELIY